MIAAIRVKPLRISGIAAAFLLFAGAWNPGFSQTRRVLTRESQRQEFFRHEGQVFRPAWEGHALLGVEANPSDEPVIFGIDKDGQTERIGFSIPGGIFSFPGCRAPKTAASRRLDHATATRGSLDRFWRGSLPIEVERWLYNSGLVYQAP